MTSKSYFAVLFTLFFILNSPILSAQSDSTVIDYSDKSYYMMGLSFDSKVLFQGRTDGVEQFGATPSFTYQHRKGFNASYSANFWSAASSQPSLHNLGLGWDFDLSDTWTISLSYARWILANGDATDQSALNNNASIDFSYAPGTWSFTAMPSFNFGSSIAPSMYFSATKFFIFSNLFSEKDKLLIMPTLSTTLATSNRFSANTTNLKKLNKNLKGLTFQPTVYELSIPVKYKVNQSLSFGFTYHYAVPLNLTSAEKNLTGLSYFSLNSSYKFYQ
jgi:hypothetical protein